MSERTKIEWCDSTFNPWIGCQPISPACDNCYAEAWAARFGRDFSVPTRTSEHAWREVLRWEKYHHAFEQVHCRRRRVFCASLGDVFDNRVPLDWRADLFALIQATPHLDWLLLTKRIGNVERMVMEALRTMFLRTNVEPPTWPWSNVWLGATIVSQAEADRDIPKLLEVPARVRFLSMEPLLSDVRLGAWLQRSPSAAFVAGRVTKEMPAWTRIGSTAIDWVIVGGESGPNARPMHPAWARSLRDQCAAAGVPFLFKQWGEWRPAAQRDIENYGTDRIVSWPVGGMSVRTGKQAAGRLLDGVENNGFPEVMS